jgi:hypothetical protein
LRGVIAFWVVYGLAHASLRYRVSHTLTIDDSRASELTQNFSLGYQIRQPPLYEWILWSVQQVLGSGISSHLVVRYSLIALLGIATYFAVREAVKDERWAAVASFSLVLSYPIGWTFHEWATQTILLSIACMVSIQAAIRFFERPGVEAAAFLGAALALGFYSKFSYPLFLGGLVLGALSMPDTRRRLGDARLLISAGIVLVALSPFLFWVAKVQGDVVSDLSSHLVQTTQSHFGRALYGLGRLATSVPTFLLPWIVFMALMAPPAFLRPSAGASKPSLAERLSWRTMLFAVIIAAAGIVLTGATNISARYMHPVLIIAPMFVFARVIRLAPGEDRLRGAAVFSIVAALVIFGIRFVTVTDNPLTRSAGRALLLPYEELAGAVRTRGATSGTLLSPSVREAGNMRSFLPGLRVIATDSLRMERPPRRASDDRSCVLLWAEGQEGSARRIARDETLTGEPIEIAAQPSGLIASREGSWLFARLDPRSPACR